MIGIKDQTKLGAEQKQSIFYALEKIVAVRSIRCRSRCRSVRSEQEGRNDRYQGPDHSRAPEAEPQSWSEFQFCTNILQWYSILISTTRSRSPQRKTKQPSFWKQSIPPPNLFPPIYFFLFKPQHFSFSSAHTFFRFRYIPIAYSNKLFEY